MEQVRSLAECLIVPLAALKISAQKIFSNNAFKKILDHGNRFMESQSAKGPKEKYISTTISYALRTSSKGWLALSYSLPFSSSSAVSNAGLSSAGSFASTGHGQDLVPSPQVLLLRLVGTAQQWIKQKIYIRFVREKLSCNTSRHSIPTGLTEL